MIPTKRKPIGADRAAPIPAPKPSMVASERKALPVELVLDRLAQNPDLANLLADHPELTVDDVAACLAYAGDAVRERRHWRTPARGWNALRTAATMSLLGHVILALLLLGSFGLEATKPESPDEAVGRICDHRFQMLKETTPVAIPVCLNRENLVDADASIRRAVLVIHGSARNAASSHAALERAAAESGSQDVLIIAPHFLTREDVEGLDPRPDVVSWGSSDWNQGDRADDPAPAARVSSFEVLDALIADISRPGLYPNLQDIVVAGHSAGGQFVHRYAAGTRIEYDAALAERQIRLRYVVANPSSYLYTVPLEPGPSISSCSRFDDYKYGLNDLNTYMRAGGPESIRSAYPQRDVTILLGRLDHTLIDPSKDDSCEALAQGVHRFNRGVRFVGALDGHYGRENHKTRLVVVSGVGHNASAIFNSPEGRRVLLDPDAGHAGPSSS